MPPVSRDSLAGWFRRAPRRGGERVGAEFEMLAVDLRTRREIAFEGERGVEAVLRRFLERGSGWSPKREGEHLIALEHGDGTTVTLEPGNQIELSTPPRDDVRALDADLRRFVREFERVTEGMDLAVLATGLNPFSSTAEVALGPKSRYRIMTDYLSRRGDLALDMMRRTLSVHCSFDYLDEADAVEKTRVAFAAAPVVTAIFANSAFEKLVPNGFQSFRAEVWRRTDPDRCGILPVVFEKDFSFARYVDAVLELPLIFTWKGGVYRAVNGLPAARWFADDLPPELRAAHAGLPPVPEDLEWVINQSFRDARLRHYLECRAADFPLPEMAAAPVALWTGLLYDATSRAHVMEVLGALSLDARRTLSADVAKRGLRANAGERTVLALARDLTAVARQALARRRAGEEFLLDSTDALLAAGKTPADVLLESFPTRADAGALIERLRLR